VSGPLNYTTKITAERTVGEVQQLLGAHGADAVAVIYEDRQPAGVSFSMATPAGNRSFQLPVMVDGVRRQLQAYADEHSVKQMSREKLTSTDHARRVAWRVVKDWLEAQVALIEAGMASLEQVMLPYLQVEPGRTLYEAYVDRGRNALEAPQ
jgi:hypothetical protein